LQEDGNAFKVINEHEQLGYHQSELVDHASLGWALLLFYYFTTTYPAVVGKLIVCQCRTSVKCRDTSLRQLKENKRNKRQMREKIGVILLLTVRRIK